MFRKTRGDKYLVFPPLSLNVVLRDFYVRQGKQGDQSYKNVRHIRHLYRILTFGVSKQAFLDFLDFLDLRGFDVQLRGGLIVLDSFTGF